jgi:hypothetical protein
MTRFIKHMLFAPPVWISLLIGLFLIAPFALSEELTCDGTPRVTKDAGTIGNESRTIPPQTDRPTVVDIGMYLTELTDIDELSSRFRFEAYGEFKWCDPRMAFDADAAGTNVQHIIGIRQKNLPFWTPNLRIANGVGSAQVTESLVEIRADGLIRNTGYFNSVVTVPFDLQHFPFDKQIFEIQIESFGFNSDALELRWMADSGGFHDEIFLPEWHIDRTDTRIEQTIEVRNRVPFSQAVYVINVSREYGYYLFKLSVPLLLIVMLSWTVFWMADGLASRIRVSATAFLTIVAYQFAISNSLPKVAYLTTMDRLMITSFILVALSALENMFVCHVFRDNPGRAEMTDRISRWAAYGMERAYQGGRSSRLWMPLPTVPLAEARSARPRSMPAR